MTILDGKKDVRNFSLLQQNGVIVLVRRKWYGSPVFSLLLELSRILRKYFGVVVFLILYSRASLWMSRLCWRVPQPSSSFINLYL